VSPLPDRRYLFETAGQWNACLFRGADRESNGASDGMTPLAPFSNQPRRIPAPGARAPCVTPAGEVLWYDATRLWRALPTSEDSLESTAAPWSLTHAARLVAAHDALWVIGTAPGTLECFDLRTLARRRVIETGLMLLDLARSWRDELIVLARRESAAGAAEHLLLHVDCAGRWRELATLASWMQPVQLACLATRDSGRVALLDADHARLMGLDVDTHAEHRQGAILEIDALWTVQLGALRACFTACQIASDGRARFLIAGAEGRKFGANPYVLVLDRDATQVDAVRLSSPANGVAGARAVLVVSQAEGIALHARVTTASDEAGLSSELITPLLRAPDTDSEIKWQRADLWASLPVGTSVELRYGSPADGPMREAALRMVADRRLSQAQKFARLEDLIENWSAPVTFTGAGASTDAADPFAFSLLDARVPEIWIHVRVHAAPRAARPSLSRMTVSYAGSALLRQLPAVFRRDAVQPGDFLGGLVGLLEATTQELDRRIDGLGSLVNPDTAPAAWLDQLAEWLGLPWDDALSLSQKRALVRAAAALAAQRGTRAGLATLLQCLFPGTPPRYRITDVDVDFGFATLGGRGCCGNALPAVLAGLPRSATVLTRRTILGAARLPCAGEEPSATRRLAGNLRVDLQLNLMERGPAQAWLARLVESLVPAGTRVSLRWQVTPSSMFDGFGELPPVPLAQLGANAVTGVARLPDSGAGSFL
jgi:phage tail-like protein